MVPLVEKDEEVRAMVNVLHRLEGELARPAGREGRVAVRSWAARCPELLAAGVVEPGEIPGWLSERGASSDLFRVLVEFAQAGDPVALSTLLVSLAPGLCALAGRVRVPVDEVVSEAASVVLDFPFARRRTVPGQLLLDTRKRFSREGERQRLRETPVGDTRVLGDREAPDGRGVDASAADQLSALVVRAWRLGVLDLDQARLVLETRVWGVSVVEAAARRGISRSAVYCRRDRAEARLGEVAL
jgi:hypothetical protein